jgi:hypothetical protein
MGSEVTLNDSLDPISKLLNALRTEKKTMEKKAYRGQWVQIKTVVLKSEERSSQLPEDTGQVPLELKVKGFLVDERAAIGDQVSVQTNIGRELTGILVAVNPPFEHDFGRAIPELLTIGNELRQKLGQGKESV